MSPDLNLRLLSLDFKTKSSFNSAGKSVLLRKIPLKIGNYFI